MPRASRNLLDDLHSGCNAAASAPGAPRCMSSKPQGRPEQTGLHNNMPRPSAYLPACLARRTAPSEICRAGGEDFRFYR